MGWTHLVHNKDLSTLAEISAATLGVDTIAGNAGGTDGNWIKCAGYNQCTLMVKYLHVTTGGNLDFNIGVSNDGGTTEYLLQSAATSSGIATLSDLKYRKVVGASLNYVVDFPLNYEYFSIRNLVLGGAAADKITITAFLGNL